MAMSRTQTIEPTNGVSTAVRPLVAREIRELEQRMGEASSWIAPLHREVGRVIVGQRGLVDRLLLGLLTNGHILIEGVPGLAKTLALKTLAGCIDGAHFGRIQFTPDMLPSDITGTTIYHGASGTFQVKHGPIFANLVLADEINRAPAKVQSALLEAMQERQVTLGDASFPLPDPFLVLATQNPLEQEGTYPLPEAQIDRFMLKVIVRYPSLPEERAILDAMAVTTPRLTVSPVATLDAIVRSRRFDPIRAELPPDVARKLYLLSIAQTVPAPSDAGRRAELAGIESWMTSAYGKGQYCPPDGSALLAYLPTEKGKRTAPCLHLGELSAVLAKSRKLDELVEAWRGWQSIAAPMRTKYARYVQLANEGARDIGFADVGALWRSGYDMSPAAFEADLERLWGEVKPLYDELHCYVRGKLQAKYGKAAVPDHAPIPSELLGNMWAQEWNNIYDVVVPYPNEPSLDVGKKLAAGHWDAKKMVHQGEHFFTALGFDALPGLN